MKTTYILLLLILSLMTSCSYDFELKGMDAAEKLVLYCMPHAGSDTTLIQLYLSQPVTQQKKEVRKDVPNARITFSVNGKDQTVRYAETDKPSVPAGCYYVVGRWNETDVIRVHAESDGLPPVYSETTIPASFPLKKVDMVRKQAIDNKLQFRITFQDDGEESYYGIRIMKKEVYEDLADDENSRTYSAIALDLELDDEPLLNNKTGLDATFDYSTDFYQYLYIWSNEQILNKEYTLRLNTYYSDDWEADDWGYHLHNYYKMYFYKLSPELYKYLKSLNDIKNNNLGSTGLAPIRSSYTNIKNGIGVLGGCQITETEWLENVH
ncbi:MAG: DUF4249 domain-containing protein [Odoribacter splanchnicus]